MMEYVKFLILLPMIIFGYQLYCYTISLKRVEKQRACRSLGIIMFPAGVICLVYHNFLAVIVGLVMIMFGLRLIAYGLERKDKNIFIDRYDEDSKQK
jgi:uncharacterized membrane protein HdeD (DUF308 family)